jgi:hypothetical protein
MVGSIAVRTQNPHILFGVAATFRNGNHMVVFKLLGRTTFHIAPAISFPYVLFHI